MVRDAYNVRRKLAGLVGVVLMGLWLLVPLLHESQHDHGHDHDAGHDEPACAMCALAGHGLAQQTCSPAVRSLPLVSEADYSRHPILPVFSHRPDVRSHGPQGPPSV